MFHLVARTRAHNLFDRWEQARSLWVRLEGVCQGAAALCLMPNHVHVLHPQDLRIPLSQSLAGHLRMVNHSRAHRVQLQSLPAPDWTQDETKLRRQARYIYLNPTRARIVEDPMAWPWSSYRDALGLTLSGRWSRHADPERLHRYVSSDPSVSMDGTLLPVGGQVDLQSLKAACSAALRVPLSELSRRGPGRSLWIQSARVLAPVSDAEIARQVGVHRATVSRASRERTPALRLVARLAGDPRFPGLPGGRGAWARW